MTEEADLPPTRPEGDYAIVEVLGHRTIVGRIAEVERFGTKFLAVEPIWQDALLPAVMVGGASIYQLTSCSAEVAFKRQPTHHYQLPPSIALTVPKPEAARLPWIERTDEEDELGDVF